MIVPQGVLLGNQDTPTALRRRLLRQNTLEAVISLPHSTFKPYASVATAILVFRKGGSTSKVWMYRVDQDGFTQNAVRLPIEDSDLPDLVSQWRLRQGQDYVAHHAKHGWVPVELIESHRLELHPQVYLKNRAAEHRYPTATIGELCDVRKGNLPASKAKAEGEHPFVTTAEELKSADDYAFEGAAVCIPTVSSTGHGHASIKRLTFVPGGKFSAATIVAVLQVLEPEKISARYLYYYLEAHKEELLVPLMKGAANVALSLTKIKSVAVPLPPINEQLSLIADLSQTEESLRDLQEQLTALREQKSSELELFTTQF